MGTERRERGLRRQDQSLGTFRTTKAVSACVLRARHRSPTQVRTISFDEMGLHPRGMDLLGVMRTIGFDRRLSHCGPIYTESTNNWYSLGSAKNRTVMLRQSLRVDG